MKEQIHKKLDRSFFEDHVKRTLFTQNTQGDNFALQDRIFTLERSLGEFVSRDEFQAQIDHKAPSVSVLDVHAKIEELHIKLEQSTNREMGRAQESRADYMEKFKDLKLMITELDKKVEALDLESDYGDEDEIPQPIKL